MSIDRSQPSFRYSPTAGIYVAEGSPQGWQPGEIRAGDRLELSAAAAVLSYGTGVFEGLKAFRGVDGAIALFRPRDHGERFVNSAQRLALTPLPVSRFVDACCATVAANAAYLPDHGAGSLYLRPLLFADEPMLGLRPAEHVRLVIYASPVGAFFADKQLSLRAVELPRQARGGTGAAKAIGNYPGGLLRKQDAAAAGFDDVLYFTAELGVQETSGANVFGVIDGRIITPATQDTVLAGITRASVMQLARDLGLAVEERLVTLTELEGAEEVFCTGTAWGVQSVGRIAIGPREVRYASSRWAQRLLEQLRGVQWGMLADRHNWLARVP